MTPQVISGPAASQQEVKCRPCTESISFGNAYSRRVPLIFGSFTLHLAENVAEVAKRIT